MESITPRELLKSLDGNGNNEILIDVRSPREYKSAHALEAKNIPLEDVTKFVEQLRKAGTVFVMCQSGNRSSQACQLLAAEGVRVVNVSGGFSEWQREGFTVVGGGEGFHIPIIRQVMMTAGGSVVLGVVLGWFVHPYWYLLSLVFGTGLLFAGVTGMCTLSWILAKMPWNR